MNEWHVIVFDADGADHVAHRSRVFAAVVSIVATAGADAGMSATAAAVTPATSPVVITVPDVPIVRHTISNVARHVRFVTPEPVVIAADAANDTPPVPPYINVNVNVGVAVVEYRPAAVTRRPPPGAQRFAATVNAGFVAALGEMTPIDDDDASAVPSATGSGELPSSTQPCISTTGS